MSSSLLVLSADGDAHVAQNWTLFYALLSSRLEELFPIVYTPTEAEAISQYSHLFRRSEGLYLSTPGVDKMEEDFLDACEGRDLDLVRSRAFRCQYGAEEGRLLFRMQKLFWASVTR